MQLGRTRNGCLEILYYPYECTILDEGIQEGALA